MRKSMSWFDHFMLALGVILLVLLVVVVKTMN
jgi:hypothetical protein